MKTLITLLLIIFSLGAFSDETEETGKSLPQYIIHKSSADPSLSRNEAVFTFTFYESNMTTVIRDEIKMSSNATGTTVHPDRKGIATLKVKPGKYVLRFFYNKNFYEIKTDSINIAAAHHTGISIHFQSSVVPVICDKPVIYLYPEETLNINVTLDLKEGLDFTYPAYEGCWNLTAEPDGTLQMKGKKYHYLFWEGQAGFEAKDLEKKEGFIVKREDLVSFLEEKLGQMGLNSKETEDYITYWCPRMNANKSNVIRFLFNEEFEKYAPLKIEPKPDHLFRVFMLWSDAGVESYPNIQPQPIPCFKRTGFTVVEWGGAEIKRSGQL
jgi:hypothetical protein